MHVSTARQKHELEQKARDGNLSGCEWINFLHEFRDFSLEIASHNLSRPIHITVFDELYILHNSMPHPKSIWDIGLEEVQISEYIESCEVDPWRIYEGPYRHYIDKNGDLNINSE
jgi:hypothetical protein